MTPFFKPVLLVLLATAFLCAPASPASCAEPAPAAKYLSGWVFADKPVAGATVEILDPAGKLLHKAEKATSVEGAFAVEVKELPADFRVVAHGGALGGKPFDAKLMADLRGFDAAKDKVYIHPVTTVVSACLDGKKFKSLEEASAAVRRALQMPEYADLGAGLLVERPYFSQIKLAAEAAKNGGMAKFIAALTADAASGKSRTLEPRKLVAAVDPSGTEKVGKGPDRAIMAALGFGVLSYIGGKSFAMGLEKVGLGGLTEDAGTKEMKAMMAKISAQLAVMQAQLNAISNHLKAVDYNVLVAPLNAQVSAVTTTYADLQSLLSLDAAANADYIKYMKERIQSVISATIMPNADMIHNQMIGTGLAGGEGMIVKWSKFLRARSERRFFTQKDSKEQIAMFEYWEAVQTMQLELVVSYLRAQKAPQAEINRQIERFKTQRAAQLAVLPPLLPEWVLVCDSRENPPRQPIMIRGNYLANPYCWGNYDRALVVLKQVNANPNWGLGFNDWRLPNHDGWKGLGWGSTDIRAMFGEAENGDFLTEAKNHGWPAEWLQPGHTTFWMDNTFRFTKNASWHARSVWSFDGYGGGYIEDVSPEAIHCFMPVRDLKPGERYYY